MKQHYVKLAASYLHKLCRQITNRHPGSAGNQRATSWVFKQLQEFNWKVSKQEFNCLDWQAGKAEIVTSGGTYSLKTGPYSYPINASARLMQITSADDLKKGEKLRNNILLFTDEIASGQLFPRNYPFYFPAEHKEIYDLLDEKQPAAVIAATGKNPEVAGSLYPFPLIEDGNFTIPNAYLKDIEGKELSRFCGEEVNLKIGSTRIPATGSNIIASKGDSLPRIVVTAHIDTKKNTPGALDNASGVIILMLLAEMLNADAFENQIEIVIFNGEDYYAASGEMQYIKELQGNWQDISLCINIDAAGHKGRKVAVSQMGCPLDIQQKLNETLANYQSLISGEPWYIGDHMIFAQNDVPVIAVTSENLTELCRDITHTPKDDIEQVDPKLLVETAEYIVELLRKLV